MPSYSPPTGSDCRPCGDFCFGVGGGGGKSVKKPVYNSNKHIAPEGQQLSILTVSRHSPPPLPCTCMYERRAAVDR